MEVQNEKGSPSTIAKKTMKEPGEEVEAESVPQLIIQMGGEPGQQRSGRSAGTSTAGSRGTDSRREQPRSQERPWKTLKRRSARMEDPLPVSGSSHGPAKSGEGERFALY